MPVSLDPAGQLPQLTVEIDVTNQPTNPTRVFTEITPYVRLLTFTRSGRNDEFQRTTPGTLNMLISNRDDALTRFETLGVQKAQWLRVSAVWQGTTTRLWQGVIEQLVRQWPASGKDATIQLTATDALKLARLYDCVGMTFPAQRVDQRVINILATIGFPVGYANAADGMGPGLYWRLGESSGLVAADSSGHGRSGTIGASGITYSVTGALVGDSNKALGFDGSTGTSAVRLASYSPLVSGQGTVTGWAKWNGPGTSDGIIFGDDFPRRVFGIVAAGSTDVRWTWDASFSTIWTNAWPGSGVYAHFALTFDATSSAVELFVNGVSQGKRIPGTLGTGGSGFAISSPAGAAHAFNGPIDEVAVFEYILTPAQISGLYTCGLLAGQGAFDTDTDTVDAVSTPLPTGSDALSQLLALEGSTNGRLIANGNGSMSFQGRHWRTVNSATPTASFADDGTGIPYRDTVEHQDDDTRIANSVNVTPLGGPVVNVQDAASQAKYFTRTNPNVDRSLLSSSATLALSAAQYLLGRCKDPTQRVPTLETQLLGLRRGSTYVATLLAAANAALNQRFTFKRTSASPITKDVYVEQVSHTIDPTVPSWTVQLSCSPADVETYWILGDTTYGVLGSTTALAY